jgi:hypothetical protein
MNKKTTLTITNEFTGFKKTTRSRNVETIKRIVRESKAGGCLSVTKMSGDDGEQYEILDTGRGDELKCIG